MKVVTLNWSFMTNTLKFPVVKAGRIVSMTDGDYVPELKVRDCARISRTPARVLAAWEYV